ncbi:aminoacyl-tRNA hydrolase [Patescibacteria group bacterium]
MKLIIGLGNPGKEYKNTRHNLGFATIDALALQFKTNNFQFKKQFNALVAQTNINGEKVILAKPQTFMNNSGDAVKKIVSYFKISPEEIMVIHDELDLPLGKFKLQISRNSAGHKGVQSIINNLGTKNFTRLRIGINHDPSLATNESTKDKEEFVLQKFTKQEQEIISKKIKKIIKAIIRPPMNASSDLGGMNPNISNTQAD